MVVRLPEGDRVSVSRKKLHADLAVAMGGRVAEEMIFGYDRVTTGASSDIQHATELARNMVTRWGLSDLLGPIMYGDSGQQEVFLGHSVTQTKNLSEATAQKVDAEVVRIVQEAYARAKQILTDKRQDLETLALALLEYETLTGTEIQDLLDGKPPVRTSVSPLKGKSTLPKRGQTKEAASSAPKDEAAPKKKPAPKKAVKKETPPSDTTKE
jgi:cell division protease FtsH